MHKIIVSPNITTMRLRHTLIALALVITSCTSPNSNPEERYLDTGISRELAEWRKATIDSVEYTLLFDLVANKGVATINFQFAAPQDVIIDFRNTELITDVKLCNYSGTTEYSLQNEHIVLPKHLTTAGNQAVTILFDVDNQSLNRREEFLYTLLVPERARTLFPSFDQPDMKACYKLSLAIPKEWDAVSNTPTTTLAEASERYNTEFGHTLPDNMKIVSFEPTEPLSTYLFSFVAGEFERRTYDDGRHSFSAYYRESDPKRLEQLDEIFAEVASALDWLEEYTGIEYPFAKYDFVILPGFQYGGMEHTGATLYNDTQMFLSEQPTLDERLRRTQLITHETAHMWFGDYVTMRWFDDVWTKEVFANYFAARMAEPLYPEVNHNLNRLKTYTQAALSEDRTMGSTSIRQELDNLRNAGLIYGQTIYNKAPIVMDKLVEIMGEEAFRCGIQEYLTTYAYGNATWDELIAILDRLTDEDLASFSDVWVNRRGMPHIVLHHEGDTLLIEDSDPLGRGLHWPQSFRITAVTSSGESVDLDVRLNGEPIELTLPQSTSYIIPNSDGRGYGLFITDDDNVWQLLDSWHTIESEIAREATVMNLNENYLHGKIDATKWLCSLVGGIRVEQNALIASSLCSYLAEPLHLTADHAAEKELYALASTHPLRSCQQQLLRLLATTASSNEVCDALYDIWHEANHPLLNINDYMTLAYELSLRYPELYDKIRTTQIERIADKERRRRFEYIIRSVNPDTASRDALFEELLEPENRRIEPWAATALSYLNHHSFADHAVRYIRRGLEELLEVQRTGDIFFPRNWVGALLGSHRSIEAYEEVERFLRENPDYQPLMRNKILQAANPLQRAIATRNTHEQ